MVQYSWTTLNTCPSHLVISVIDQVVWKGSRTFAAVEPLQKYPMHLVPMYNVLEAVQYSQTTLNTCIYKKSYLCDQVIWGGWITPNPCTSIPCTHTVPLVKMYVEKVRYSRTTPNIFLHTMFSVITWFAKVRGGLRWLNHSKLVYKHIVVMCSKGRFSIVDLSRHHAKEPYILFLSQWSSDAGRFEGGSRHTELVYKYPTHLVLHDTTISSVPLSSWNAPYHLLPSLLFADQRPGLGRT